MQLTRLTTKTRLTEEEFSSLMSALAHCRQISVADEELLGLYGETLSESLFIDSASDVPNCLECGACCAHFHQIPVQVQDATPRSLTWAVFETDDLDEQPLHWLRREPQGGMCVAFDGGVGERASCAIYELRPLACRVFESGSDRCRALRRLYGIEPALPADQNARHIQILIQTADNSGAARQSFADIESEETYEGGLRELIAYNLVKLAEIVAEIERVKTLPVKHGEYLNQVCDEAIREVTDDQLAIVGTREQMDTKPLTAEVVARELLQIGGFSQECVERAAEQLAKIGELAFEALGLKARIKTMEACGQTSLYNLSSPRQ